MSVNLNEAAIAFSKAKPMLLLVTELGEAIERARSLDPEIRALEARKVEAETAYRQAHGERAQIIEGIENLKKQYAQLSADLPAAYADARAETAKRIGAAKADADSKIVVYAQSIAKAESDAAQRIAKAEAAANEAESRVKRAEAALEALKRA